MTTNDQPHAEVTEEMKQLAHELAERFIGWPLPKTVCADLVSTMHGEANRIGTNLLSFEEAKQMLMEVVVPILTARESLLTASNEDLARQVEEKDAAIKKLDHEGFYQELQTEMALRIKCAHEAHFAKREATDLAAQVVKLTERADKAESTQFDKLGEAALKIVDLRALATRLAKAGDEVVRYDRGFRELKDALADARKANLLK